MDEVGKALNQALRSDGKPVLAGGYRKGDRVELHSLKGAAEHNGKCGTVVGRQGERVQVRLDDAKTLALKTTNLTKLVAMPDASTMRRAFAELSAAEKKANAALPPGAGMESPCVLCGGARPHGKNDEFLPCCGVSVCSGCSMAASMRGVPCGKCGKTVPQMPNDLLDAYARLAAAGHEGARRRGLTLAAMLKVPEEKKRQFVSELWARRPGGLNESEGAEYVAQCLHEGRAPNLDLSRPKSSVSTYITGTTTARRSTIALLTTASAFVMKRAPPATPSKVAKRRAAATPKAKPKRAAATTPASSHTPDWATTGLAHVAKADGGRLKAIIDEHGPPGYLAEQVAEDSACGALCRIVVGQQLAGAAAASIWRRTVGELCPRGFDRAELLSRAEGDDGFDEETRSACGLSRAKARAIVAVCRAFEAGDLSDALLRDAPVEELREKLCAIKGVGPWSCDMYLIFDLKKPDVLPLGDLGVRNGAQRFFGVSGHGKNGSLDPKKDRVKLEALFAPYAPYRSLASCYMWRVADTKAFNQKQ